MRGSILIALSLFMSLGLGMAQQPVAPVAESPAATQPAGDGVNPPVPLTQVDAVYPSGAASSRLNGRCAVSAVIDTNGIPRELKIIRCADPVFEKNSLDAVAKYRFKPATNEAGTPVVAAIAIEINFRTSGGHDSKIRITYSRYTPPGVTSFEPTPDGVYPYSKNITPPTLVAFSDEGYGDAAFTRVGASGCDLVLTIDRKGKASNPESVHCETSGLGIAIIHSLTDSKFEPGKVDGKPVAVRMAIHIEFVGFFPEH